MAEQGGIWWDLEDSGRIFGGMKRIAVRCHVRGGTLMITKGCFRCTFIDSCNSSGMLTGVIIYIIQLFFEN